MPLVRCQSKLRVAPANTRTIKIAGETESRSTNEQSAEPLPVEAGLPAIPSAPSLWSPASVAYALATMATAAASA